MEEFYLKNRSRYYDIVGEAIETEDLTTWLEFFANGLLYGAMESVKILQKLSGGGIDLATGKFSTLTDNQMQIISALQGVGRTSGAEIGRRLGLSRQYVNNLMNELIDMGLIEKTGTRRSATYGLVHGFRD